MPRLITLPLLACLGLALGGCELIIDFDRSQIPLPPPPDAGSPTPDAGTSPDAAAPDGG